MNNPLFIALDASGITSVFGQVLRRMAGKPALMREVAGIMFDEVEENFAQQGRPRWLDIKSVNLARAGYTRLKSGRMAYLKRKGNGPSYMILQDSGRLASSITQEWTAGSATVGTNVVYAKIHQFGGKTRKHDIRPKNGKYLLIGGRPHRMAVVSHPGSDIPARPFLMVTPSGEGRIVRAGEAFLRNAIST